MTGRLIAFTGRAGSGKSTAADALRLHRWQCVKFATPLKSMLTEMYAYLDLSPEQIKERVEGSLKEVPDPCLGGQTPRHAMQTLGTEWGRDLIAKDIWIEAWRQRVFGFLSRGIDVVCDDCRFEDEAQAVRDLGGHVVEIRGRKAKGKSKHSSENFGFAADMTIDNGADQSRFEQSILYIFHRTDAGD